MTDAKVDRTKTPPFDTADLREMLNGFLDRSKNKTPISDMGNTIFRRVSFQLQ